MTSWQRLNVLIWHSSHVTHVLHCSNKNQMDSFQLARMKWRSSSLIFWLQKFSFEKFPSVWDCSLNTSEETTCWKYCGCSLRNDLSEFTQPVWDDRRPCVVTRRTQFWWLYMKSQVFHTHTELFIRDRGAFSWRLHKILSLSGVRHSSLYFHMVFIFPPCLSRIQNLLYVFVLVLVLIISSFTFQHPQPVFHLMWNDQAPLTKYACEWSQRNTKLDRDWTCFKWPLNFTALRSWWIMCTLKQQNGKKAASPPLELTHW